MATSNKLDLVLHVWNSSANTRRWFMTQIDSPVTADDFTAQSVRAYGLDGHGDVADSIIESGVSEKIISREQAENECL